ncbi:MULTISPECIES: type II secretion system protein [unclassified Deinococcus]|uniref:type II secretion system protein n=1 Tax=unclassified Deinococcus TaxID=2623546 RepID=UPI001C308E7A|nr:MULTISPECIES: prepilin-type N-terminal cleavage/methylation domain-containing protein [unclassified Deinococcus]MDK2013616.1 prepilin-type N-terminal cleavage/methylation domain-containing protein [Deinococcus sp. 43]
MKNTTQGFTLIELLIVIAIIGILAAVLIPNLLGAQKRAYDTAAQSCANSLAKAIAIYRVDNPTTSNTPAAADLFTTTAQQEEYGTSGCASPDLNVAGAASATGAYSFTVSHDQGRNLYTLTQAGIASAAKP